MSESDDKSDKLHDKLREWLDSEGYPLEFATANTFRRSGFAVRQGTYVRDEDSENPREIDVTASMHTSDGDSLIRIYHVVECKWSQDKPWIVFTSHHGMGSAACVTQTISSLLGSAILWKEAGLESLHELDLFATPDRSGFNGRQAFSKGNDYFYNSMRSVTTLSTLLVQNYERPNRPEGTMPRNAIVAFPVIVVDGKLFEAFFDRNTNGVLLSAANHVRCHWKGAPAWRLHATVDIVAFSHLETFAKQRHLEVQHLMAVMQAAHTEVGKCFRDKSLEGLNVTKGARGIVGLHRLFREIHDTRKRLEGPEPEKDS